MFIGIDLGTSGLKTILIDSDQRVLASATQGLIVSRPHEGWSEQNPEDWLHALTACLASLKSQSPVAYKSVKAISFSGHMHGATVLNRHGSPLRPCILWNDTRASTEAQQLDSDPQFRQLTGNIVFPGFTAPKLLWMKNNEAGLFAQTDCILLPKDYLRFVLSGEKVSDYSDASGTAWLDVANRCWSEPLLNACGLKTANMPRLIEGCQGASSMTRTWSEKLGFDRSPLLGGGAGDNAASAIALGNTDEGQVFVSLGTSGVVFGSNRSFRPNPDSAVHTFCHALPERWHHMGVILSATDSLNWLSSITHTSVSDLMAALESFKPENASPLFLPYLSGERTPHNLAQAAGMFAGLSHRHTAMDLCYAVIEGVAFALKENLQALDDAGTRSTSLSAVGGGSQSDVWLQLLSTLLEIPIDRVSDSEHGAALGAARLAMLATGSFSIEATCTPPETTHTFSPASIENEFYLDRFQRFQKLRSVL